ncbi:hypothetical protein IMPR6_690294 [Imperialibacter sp. EC-SDR9]|nr:hypothetical protein IMPERIA75_700294 [Imperialibacter sp. 75]VVT34138.1 hypothetical protein IMPR6_690294 [Imperialibacter sp. EC-SDR9]
MIFQFTNSQAASAKRETKKIDESGLRMSITKLS